jgi:hypothetical protein
LNIIRNFSFNLSGILMLFIIVVRNILLLVNSLTELLIVILIKIVIWCLITVFIFSWLLNLLTAVLLQFLKYIFLWVLVQDAFIMYLLGLGSLLCQLCLLDVCILNHFAQISFLIWQFAFLLDLRFNMIKLILLFLRKIIYH